MDPAKQDFSFARRAPKVKLPSVRRFCGSVLLLSGCLVCSALAGSPSAPSLQRFTQGKWLSWHGSASDVKVVGNYAYVALLYGGLAVLDVSHPANPVVVGGYDAGRDAYGVEVAGNYAYVAEWDAGLQVIDVSNPTNCVRVGGCSTVGPAIRVAVVGNYAYVVAYGFGLHVIDVSNPRKCV
jgi:hypothetical protein